MAWNEGAALSHENQINGSNYDSNIKNPSSSLASSLLLRMPLANRHWQSPSAISLALLLCACVPVQVLPRT
jgi:hypothetical protein